MLLSTQTDLIFRKLGIDRGIEVFADAGYDAIDFSMFSTEQAPLDGEGLETFAKGLRAKTEAAGLRFNQAHAPFPGWKHGDDAYNARLVPQVENAVRIAGMLGAKAVVVHPIPMENGMTTNKEAQKEFNLNYYRKLEPIALQYGVRIALENMWGYNAEIHHIVPNVCSFGTDLAEYYDELNPKAFTVCLDLGHSGLVGDTAQAAIRALGKDRLGALHIHDNNNTDDSHTLPYSYGCKMKWNEITRALGEIDYQGDFTYEADNFLVRYEPEALPAAEKFMAALGRTMIARIDACRPAKG